MATKATQQTRHASQAQASQQESCGAGQAVERVIKENAVGSAAIMFGIGIGAGLAIAGIISQSTQPRHSSLAHRLGEQMLNSVHSALPDTLFKH